MSGRQPGGERSPSFVRLLVVMALACLAPVVALGLVGSPTEDNDNVTAAGRTRPPTTGVDASSMPTTTAAPTTTTAPAPTVSAAPSAAEVVVYLVNVERAAATPRCGPLAFDDALTTAAQRHSDDMAANDYFSHTSLDGATAQDRAEAAGFTGLVGENIAAGQRSPQDVMAAWMGSEGHRANILNCDYTVIGVGLNTDGWYWTQMFGTPS